LRLLRPLAAVVLAAATLTAGPSAAAPAEYVALGDSYSSGTGAGSYTSLLCRRSANAYPALIAAARPGAAFKFVACSGATVSDVAEKQLSALSGATTLVTVSVGGNDAGFASAMISCRYGAASWCRAALEKGRRFIEEKLPARLDSLYAEIRARAPRAEVVVVGYPRLYREDGPCPGGPDAARRAMINEAADRLARVTAARAAAAGFSFADARPAFAGHEICGDDPWIDAFHVHPTAVGHSRGYLPAVAATAS